MSDIYLDRSEWKGRAEVAEARVRELETYRDAYRIVEEQAIKKLQAAEDRILEQKWLLWADAELSRKQTVRTEKAEARVIELEAERDMLLRIHNSIRLLVIKHDADDSANYDQPLNALVGDRLKEAEKEVATLKSDLREVLDETGNEERDLILMAYELKVLKAWATQAAEALRPLAAPTDAHRATTTDFVLTGYIAPLGDCRRASEVLAAMPSYAAASPPNEKT